MSINDPNLINKLNDIESRLSSIEMRLEVLERVVRGPPVRPGPEPMGSPPGSRPEPFRF